MELRQAIEKAYQELETARLEKVNDKAVEILEALDAGPVADALANSLYFTLAEVESRRPGMTDIIARHYLAIGIWIGRRVGELMAAEAITEKKKPNGQ